MDERLQEMLDHFEIRRTLSEYCHGCDRGDELHMASVYAEDSWDDHGHVKAPGAEFARIMSKDVVNTTNTLSHMLGQSLINIDGDTAGAETYFIAVARLTNEDGDEMCNQLGGRFVDKLIRENGRWLIKHRVVVRDWTVGVPLEHDWVSATALILGSRSNEDPSYEALGIKHSGIPVPD